MKLFAIIEINKMITSARLWNKNTYPKREEQLINGLKWQIGRLNFNYGLDGNLYDEKEPEPNEPEVVKVEHVRLDRGFFTVSFNIGLLSRLSGKKEGDIIPEALNRIGGWLLSQLYLSHELNKWIDTKKLGSLVEEDSGRVKKYLPNAETIEDIGTYASLHYRFLMGLAGYELVRDNDDDFIEGFCKDGFFSRRLADRFGNEVKLADHLCGNLRIKHMENANGESVIYICQIDRSIDNQGAFSKDFVLAVQLIEKSIASWVSIFSRCYFFININPSLKLPLNSTQKLRGATACEYIELIETI